MYGFSFKGMHSDNFNVFAKTVSRDVLPTPKFYEYDLPNMDGSIDFSVANIDGRVKYNDRLFDVELLLQSKNLMDLQKDMSKLVSWLNGYGKLIFDDLPDVYWNAKVIQNISYTPYTPNNTKLNVTFKCEPFSYGLETIQNNYSLSAGTNSVSIENIGGWSVRPVFMFSAGSYVTVAKGNKKFEYSRTFATLEIDFKKFKVYRNGLDDTKNSSGYFFELDSGDNNLTVGVSESADLFVSYRPKYIYGKIDSGA